MHEFCNAEYFESDILRAEDEKISKYSEMLNNERYFLNGLIRYLKPKKMLEVGVAGGGSSAIMLNATRDIDDSILFSVDYLDKYWIDSNKKTGFVITDYFPEFADRYKLYTGGDVSKHIEKVGNGVELTLLDTTHMHPTETLNFLCILPFLNTNSWVVLHDISLHFFNEKSLACKYLYGHVVSENKISPTSDFSHSFSNIGTFQVTDLTHQCIENVSMSLTIPWIGWDDNWILSDDFHDIDIIIKKYYDSSLYKIFKDSVCFQSKMQEQWKKVPNSEKIERALYVINPKLCLKIKKSIQRNERIKNMILRYL